MSSPQPIAQQRNIPARIAGVALHLPERILGNDELAGLFETWTADKILEKTGILQRHIAAEDETALDLGVAAARKLLDNGNIDAGSIDFLIFCSQAHDHVLPSSACIMQERLGLPKSVGALDITLGCSGFVYGLSLACGLISAGMASRILLVTADTYSKFIHPLDKSVRTLFGDAAAATLVERCGEGQGEMGSFIFGTDGRGASELIVEAGGARLPRSMETAKEEADEFGNVRSRDNLYMNGSAVMNFTLREVPRMFAAVKESAGLSDDDIDHVVMHQANLFMLEALRKKMRLAPEKVPYFFETIGNTVSTTIPAVLANLIESGQIRPGSRCVLLGFGVGLSWAGCVVRF